MEKKNMTFKEAEEYLYFHTGKKIKFHKKFGALFKVGTTVSVVGLGLVAAALFIGLFGATKSQYMSLMIVGSVVTLIGLAIPDK